MLMLCELLAEESVCLVQFNAAALVEQDQSLSVNKIIAQICGNKLR